MIPSELNRGRAPLRRAAFGSTAGAETAGRISGHKTKIFERVEQQRRQETRGQRPVLRDTTRAAGWISGYKTMIPSELSRGRALF